LIGGGAEEGIAACVEEFWRNDRREEREEGERISPAEEERTVQLLP